MRKARNKKLSLLIALVFAFTAIFPVGAAFAAKADFGQSYSYISTGDDKSAGSITVKQKDNSTADAVYVEVNLPDGVEFENEPKSTTDLSDEVKKASFDSAGKNWMRVAVTKADWEAATEIKINFTGDLALSIDDDFTGNLKVEVEVIGVTGGQIAWTETDSLIIAKVAKSEVTVSVDKVKKVSKGNKDVAAITLEESKAGDFANNEVVTLEIETDGVTFNTVNPIYNGVGLIDNAGYTANELEPTHKDYTGYRTATGGKVVIHEDGETAKVKVSQNTSTFPGKLKFELNLSIDPDVTGDIEINVKSSDSSGADLNETVTVATVGDVAIEIDKLKDNDGTVYAGQSKKLKTNFILQTTDGSNFKTGDIITFKLSAGKFVDAQVENNGKSHASVKLYDDDKAFYYSVDSTKNKVKIDDIEIKLNNDAEPGDITLSIGGDYGDLDEIVIATAAKPYTVTADKPSILAEALGQAAGDIIITETKEGAMKKAEEILVELPSGVELSGKPKIEVTEGNADAKIKQYDEDFFVIELTKESTSKPSVFRVYNIKYDTGKLALAGDVELKFYGDDEANNPGTADKDNDYKDDSLMTTVVNAVVVDGSVVTASFKVGDEGVAVRNGRTLVQVNTLCDTLGLQKSWDETNKIAYFIKSGTVVAFPIGQNQIIINGNTIPVDQGGVIIDGFTYATLRGIQAAFGGDLTWDDETKTATFNF